MGTRKEETWRTTSPINCFSHAKISLSGTCACVKGKRRERVGSLAHHLNWCEGEREEKERGRKRREKVECTMTAVLSHPGHTHKLVLCLPHLNNEGDRAELSVELLRYCRKIKSTVALCEGSLCVRSHSDWRLYQDRIGRAKERIAIPAEMETIG